MFSLVKFIDLMNINELEVTPAFDDAVFVNKAAYFHCITIKLSKCKICLSFMMI